MYALSSLLASLLYDFVKGNYYTHPSRHNTLNKWLNIGSTTYFLPLSFLRTVLIKHPFPTLKYFKICSRQKYTSQLLSATRSVINKLYLVGLLYSTQSAEHLYKRDQVFFADHD